MAADGGPRTIVEKILDAHTVHEEGGRRLIYIDRLLVADTALSAFRALAARGETMRRPGQALLVPDHYVPSGSDTADRLDAGARRQLEDVQDAGEKLGVGVVRLGDPRRGIQHVTAAEQAFAQPGIVLAAVDSHTTTQGALGAFAFSLGTDLPHALATQCAWLKPPRMMLVRLEGRLRPGVVAKDVALALVAMLGAGGATGHAVEFGGTAIADMSPEARATICNMSVEMGAAVGIVAPDARTEAYLKGRPMAPNGADWDRATAQWRTLPSDEGASYDIVHVLDVGDVAPMVTWGNSADTALPVTGRVPDPADEPIEERRVSMLRSLAYMGLAAGAPLDGMPVDQVFIGSCTNARIEDLRAAASVLRGRRVAVPTLVVPGSGLVREAAEREGIADVFLSAGARWGEAGCSMCVSMNGDIVAPGARCASTSNRNHMGRQGRGSRTHLVSPPMAAAAAVAGRIVDVRTVSAA